MTQAFVLFLTCLYLILKAKIFIESQNGLDWKGPQRPSGSNTLPRAGTPSTSPGCSEPHPSWPWTLPGRGQPHLRQDLTILRAKSFFLLSNLNQLFQFKAITPCLLTTCPCKRSVTALKCCLLTSNEECKWNISLWYNAYLDYQNYELFLTAPSFSYALHKRW